MGVFLNKLLFERYSFCYYVVVFSVICSIVKYISLLIKVSLIVLGIILIIADLVAMD